MHFIREKNLSRARPRGSEAKQSLNNYTESEMGKKKVDSQKLQIATVQKTWGCVESSKKQQEYLAWQLQASGTWIIENFCGLGSSASLLWVHAEEWPGSLIHTPVHWSVLHKFEVFIN